MSLLSTVHSKFRKLQLTAQYVALRATSHQWLFVVGHMRSGSSLMVHILNSNPDILGYGETHIPYRSRRTLAKLHRHIRDEFANNGAHVGPHRYTMDKILHDHIRNASVLKTGPLKVLVTVRTPDNALPSILDLNMPSIQRPEEALAYYTSALERIDRWIGDYGRPYVLVNYDDLVRKPDAVLDVISSYLELDEPLSPTYEVTWATGKRGIGDTSETIRTQKIEEKDSSYEAVIPDAVQAQATEHYERFLGRHDDYRARRQAIGAQ